MIISSTITVNMNKTNKVSIGTTIEEGTIQEPFLDLESVDVNDTVITMRSPLDETIPREQAIHMNETIMRDKALELIHGQIQMYKDLFSEVAKVVEKYDITLERSSE